MRLLQHRHVKRTGLIALQLLISAGAIALLFRGLDLGRTAEAFGDANYWLLVPAVALLVLDLQLRAVRWRLLLAAKRHLSHNNLFGASNVGYLVNNVLPLRLGEVARVLVVDRLERTGKVRTGASVLIERGLDAVAMVVLVVALFPFVDEPSWATGPALLFGAIVIGGLLMLIVASHVSESGTPFWRPLLLRIPRAGPTLEELSEAALRGFDPLRRIGPLAAVAALTVVIWLLAAASFWTIMMAFNIEPGFEAAALVLGATTLGMVVPSSPGYAGVFHAIAVETLVQVFGVPKEEALTYAFAQHGVIYFVPGIMGAVFLLRHRGMWDELVASLRARFASPAPVAEELRRTVAPGTDGV